MPDIPYWTQTVTVLSRLAGRDSATKLDTWKKTKISGCFFKTEIQRGLAGTAAAVGMTAVCRIPEQPDFKPYSVWKNDIASGFSISVGDHIILGEVSEDVTAANVAEVVAKHRPNAMTVKAFADNTAFPFGGHYRVEGV